MSDLLLPHDATLERLRTLHPIKIDLTLGRTYRLLDDLGRPQDRLPPTVHVAGTNGKGSTVAFLRAIVEAAGMKTHVLTSPHLVRFAERIRVAGALIGDDQLEALLERVERANAGQPITFFEITTAAALTAFADTPADLCIVEVGLGGRFDATNVIEHPAVSVITPIDLDHKEYLGDTVAQIAGEKAGIIKAGRPVVSARQSADAEAVLDAEAERRSTRIQMGGRDFDSYPSPGGMAYQDAEGLLELPAPSLLGPHQLDNAALAVAAAMALGDARIDAAAIARGVAQAVWPARMQRLDKGPLARIATAAGADLWLDGGHNPHAARAVARVAADMRARDGRPLTIVVGLLERKDARGVFSAFEGLGARLITTGFGAALAASADSLAAAAGGQIVEPAPDPTAAVRLACAWREAGQAAAPHIIVCGSLYLAGEILSLSKDTWPV